MSTATNGYGFANFSAADTTEEFGTDDLVAMFGNTEEVCAGGAEPCSPTPEAAAFARMVNQERSSGHCEGLVVTAATRFIADKTPVTGELPKAPATVHEILQGFATQFGPEARKDSDNWATKSMGEIVAAVRDNLAKNVPEYTLNVYSEHGGHALLPIAVDLPAKDTAVVHVYDSNWPGKDRFVTFDVKNDKWSFSFSGPDPTNDPGMWTGGKGDVDITSLTSRSAGACPFCSGDGKPRNSALVIRAAGDDVKVTTEDGTVTPSSPRAGATSIRPLAGPGADPGDGQPRDYLVSIPAASKSVSVTAGSQVRIVSLTPTAIAEVQTPESGTTQAVTFGPGSVSVDDPAVALTLASGDHVVTSTGRNNTIVADDKGVTATVDGAGGAPVTASATDAVTAVEITGAGAPALPQGADHVTSVQSTTGKVEQTVVGTDGKESTTAVSGQLANTSTSVELPPKLAATDDVPGLPPIDERTGVDTPVTTTSVAPAGDGNDSGTTGTSGSSTTKTTVKPRTTTTLAQKTTQRTAVSVGINLDEWSYGPSDSASSGFSAVLTATNSDSPSCSTAACLEGMVVDTVTTGTDPATGRTVTSTAGFTMKNVAVPFSIRCGAKGSWVTATQSAGTYSASCSITSVTADDYVYLRA